MNRSNTKWLSIGVSCTPTIAFPDSAGSKAKAQLCGDKGTVMVIGDARSLRNLFMTIRSDDECQYVHIGTRSDYSNCATTFGINKANFSGTRCLQINNQQGQSCFLSMASVDELLKRELIMLRAITAATQNEAECEQAFAGMLADAGADYNGMVSQMNAIRTDIFCNFTDEIIKTTDCFGDSNRNTLIIHS